ncbi:hypothetical protein MSAN_01168300 [Mycena sanguinolenta]|uniref:Uncharacterized protein n=1 Tax=Mycena sanguinolenta TaxID=230812 RepID=A0A8H6YN89_9AGAR|nr:hypothetical protein MSAN_01168300 [Mycena sanguinolenta]
MSTLSTLCDVAVSAVFDRNAAGSSVSLDWVLNSGIRTHNSRVSGLLTLPTNLGVLSVSVNGVLVAPSLPSDLVLGLDWFSFVCETTSDTIVHLASGPLELSPCTTGIDPAPFPSVPSSSSAATMFRGDISANPSSSSPVSGGGPGVVLTPSPSPRTRGAGAVAASTLAALRTPPYARCLEF